MKKESPLQTVQQQINKYCQEFGRHREDVQLIAVSKTRNVQAVQAMAEEGQLVFGENYLQEGVDKVTQLNGRNLQWHFIGHIQSKKATQIAQHFSWVHTLERIKVAQKLQQAMSIQERGADKLNVLIQLNLQGEMSKSGVAPQDLNALVDAVQELDQLNLCGLMLIPKPSENFDAQRKVFSQARELLEQMASNAPQMRHLSMGMSGDLRAAIAEGATLVRVGTALFGPRDYVA